MGKGKRAKKRRPFLEEDDDVEQSEGYHIHVTASVKPEPVQMKDIIFCRGATLLPKMPSSPKPQTFVRGGPVSVRPGALCISSSRHRGVPPHWDPSAET
ncbi:hypothetical protein KUCAC02_029655 [Chaenocephalus aceratus]|nr:hypothetical protein KUCAC02_029655 [Chaenocephalus aceratus]